MGSNVTITNTSTGHKIEGVYWKAPTNDTTIPSSDDEVKGHVNTLVRAMKNNEGCCEQINRPQFSNRWETGADFYSTEEYEAAAQEIVVSHICARQ